MWYRNTAAKSALGFLLLYGLLLVPWPGWNATYGRFFRSLGGVCFGREGSRWVVHFQPAENPPRPEIDTAILLAPNLSPDAAGQVHGKILSLDTRGVGWVPTALLIALVLASPVPWFRRLTALILGLLLIQGYLLLVLAAYLWSESGGLVPVSFLPFSPAIGTALEETLVTQMGPSFVVPVVLWLAIAFRREDWARLFPPKAG